MSLEYCSKKNFNIIKKLRIRTYNNMSPHAIFFFHQNIIPLTTVQNVQLETAHLRKFSPNGRYLVTFTTNMMDIILYEYLGIGQAASKDASLENIFDKVFRKRQPISINRQFSFIPQCCIFTKDSRYLVAGGTKQNYLSTQDTFDARLDHNDGLVLYGRMQVSESFHIMLINLETCTIVDFYDFHKDLLLLSTIHGLSISVYMRKVAILCLGKQNIMIFDIVDDEGGKFRMCEILGQFLTNDEYETFMLHPTLATDRPTHQNTSKILTQMKQKILAFIFREAHFEEDASKRKHNLARFYHHVDMIKKLKLWKLQLLDNHRLLLRYTHEKLIINKQDQGAKYNLWVILNYATSTILQVYGDVFENLHELLNAYETNRELFEGSHLRNNIYALEIQRQLKQNLITARNGGLREATIRTLSQLPFSCQAIHESPLLDRMLFRYNEKYVPVLDRPWNEVSEHPIGFFHQHQNALAFQPKLQLHTETNTKWMVAFTYHPTDPFIISVQRRDTHFCVNFHIKT